MPREWGGLRPEQVAQWINFEQGNAGWSYRSGEKSMFSRQAEGVAHLWNGLSRDRVALLADEVGTGKTFQALGVVALLWRMNPKAKVLVMAPNRDICQHWENELAAFVKHHYREADGRVKQGDKAIPAAAAFYGLHELTEAIEKRLEQERPTQLYITSIRSLSGLLKGDGKAGRERPPSVRPGTTTDASRQRWAQTDSTWWSWTRHTTSATRRAARSG
ncbi:DEAD/DEAH box helicase family protein [Stenotrophomonas rhizophila]